MIQLDLTLLKPNTLAHIAAALIEENEMRWIKANADALDAVLVTLAECVGQHDANLMVTAAAAR